VFVVFRHPSDARAYIAPALRTTTLATIGGPWRLSFPPGLDAPAEISLPALASWSEHPDPGVKYFSGTAAYARTFEVPTSWLRPDSRLMLDLGTVREIAEVSVNGKVAGVAWKAPYVVDVTDAVKAGPNSLTIRVTNLWPNRMIGDAQPGARKHTWTAMDVLAPDDPVAQLGRAWTADSQLLPSGLLGPVRLMRATP
jgi:hypothetical protein